MRPFIGSRCDGDTVPLHQPVSRAMQASLRTGILDRAIRRYADRFRSRDRSRSAMKRSPRSPRSARRSKDSPSATRSWCRGRSPSGSSRAGNAAERAIEARAAPPHRMNRRRGTRSYRAAEALPVRPRSRAPQITVWSVGSVRREPFGSLAAGQAGLTPTASSSGPASRDARFTAGPAARHPGPDSAGPRLYCKQAVLLLGGAAAPSEARFDRVGSIGSRAVPGYANRND